MMRRRLYLLEQGSALFTTQPQSPVLDTIDFLADILGMWQTVAADREALQASHIRVAAARWRPMRLRRKGRRRRIGAFRLAGPDDREVRAGVTNLP